MARGRFNLRASAMVTAAALLLLSGYAGLPGCTAPCCSTERAFASDCHGPLVSATCCASEPAALTLNAMPCCSASCLHGARNAPETATRSALSLEPASVPALLPLTLVPAVPAPVRLALPVERFVPPRDGYERLPANRGPPALA